MATGTVSNRFNAWRYDALSPDGCRGCVCDGSGVGSDGVAGVAGRSGAGVLADGAGVGVGMVTASGLCSNRSCWGRKSDRPTFGLPIPVASLNVRHAGVATNRMAHMRMSRQTTTPSMMGCLGPVPRAMIAMLLVIRG